MITDKQKYFKENDYIVIEDLIAEETRKLMYEYCKTQALVSNWRFINKSFSGYDGDWDGKWSEDNAAFKGKQTYMKYGDMLTDSLMMLCHGYVEEITSLKLHPTYSFWRLYEKDDSMGSHRDRPGCEISVSLNLGCDISNLKDKEYCWPIYLRGTKHPDGLPILLKPGAGLIYKGIKNDHWRDHFKGLNQAQTFLHYSTNEKEFLDGRPLSGLPKIQIKYEKRVPITDY